MYSTCRAIPQLTTVYRGLAGTVLVYKIAGALAHRGGSLDEVYKIAEWTSQNIATVGTSLGHVHVGPFRLLLV